ncbi:membrane protein insertion efficiency factor YidD [Engelhardtia mirabilis]|uniref:Putative membrane protein insertion efficiency factor n=1 Tax=Engelhardtia mirabilis TaxID=2528011 RepID=A0A518BJE4_9BACT|nr:Putative membrane protein insertion efficiency factor [Planctomycetes bacterium Pla133]QDV01427.1 Putative membrane protein insertion efficiency factor [Planctomycetes bacterium Pla86]
MTTQALRPPALARAARWLAVLPIRAYARLVSPYTPATCRFRPTCSGYAREAIELHGVLRGTWLGIRRVLRCHPFSDPGLDPVPNSPFDRRTPATARLVTSWFTARMEPRASMAEESRESAPTHDSSIP